MLTRKAQEYAWRELARRAGVDLKDAEGTGFEDLHIETYYALPGHVRPSPPAIIIVPCSEMAWFELLHCPPYSLSSVSVQDVLPENIPFRIDNPKLPILFWGVGYEDSQCSPVEFSQEGVLIFYIDIIALTFFMLTRWPEQAMPLQDQHGRFPGKASVAYKQGFLDRPIVDEYALIFQAWLKVLLPNWSPNPSHFSVKLTHDIDQLTRRFITFSDAVKTFGGDLLKRHNMAYARQTAIDTFAQYFVPTKLSYFSGIKKLVTLSKRYGFGDDAFYFKVASPTQFDVNVYDFSTPVVRQCLEMLRCEGFEVGLHPGYYTFDNPELLAVEKARFDAILGFENYGGRQHYLRFRAPDTWRHWQEVGLVYDSTLGYADCEGFRCGTCYPYRPFDIELDCELNLWEYPLIAMDSTLAEYRGFTPEEGKQCLFCLARRCKQVGGVFTILWHNTTLDWIWSPWAEVYEQLLVKLAGM